jgi:hypothetical protein
LAYQAWYENFLRAGIDEIYCASANDGAVMRQWFLSRGCVEDTGAGILGFKYVKPLPGGHRLFRSTSACSWSNLNVTALNNFQRSAAIINDMKVEQIFTESGTPDSSTAKQISSSPMDPEFVLTYLESSKFMTKLLVPKKNEHLDRLGDMAKFEKLGHMPQTGSNIPSAAV